MEETRAARTAQILAPQGRDHVAADLPTSTGAPGDMADFGRPINEPTLRGDMRDRDQLGSPTDRALGREIERVLSSSV